jgi:hypothetical protein
LKKQNARCVCLYTLAWPQHLPLIFGHDNYGAADNDANDDDDAGGDSGGDGDFDEEPARGLVVTDAVS